MLKWVENFLIKIKQYFVSEESPVAEVTSGVQQGTVLGRIHF